jgi:phospholipase/lecithinase/hemolysin
MLPFFDHMPGKVLVVSALMLYSPVYSAFADTVGSFNQLVVFGDSLSDNGNISLATAGVFPGPNYATRTVPGTDLTVGMYTDGPNTTPAVPSTGPFGLWIDQFASKMNLADPQPFLAGTGGTDYAVASAETGSSVLMYYVSDQVNSYLSTRNGAGASSTALYTFWAGANDILDGKNPITAADNIYQNILTLASTGARNFLWLNLPDLGDTPDGKASGQSTALNTASSAFDAEWSVNLAKLQGAGINVIGVNVQNFVSQLLDTYSAYGFTNVTTPAQGLAGINPNDYVFWDGKHPTTAGDTFVADLAFDDFVDAPEPSTVTFAVLGFLALLSAVKLRR